MKIRMSRTVMAPLIRCMFAGVVTAILLAGFSACSIPGKRHVAGTIKPIVITETVQYDSDDPAIWMDRTNIKRAWYLALTSMRMVLFMYSI